MTTTITIPNVAMFKQKALSWANKFRVVCLLDSNSYPIKKYAKIDWLLAVDALSEIKLDETENTYDYFQLLNQFKSDAKSDIFGYISYDVKNRIEILESKNYDGLKFPELYFFEPRYVLEIKENKLTVNRNYPETFEIYEAIEKTTISNTNNKTIQPKLKLNARTNQEKYLATVENIRQQIIEGDFYELNYCNEFYAENINIDALAIFFKLNQNAQAPYSSYFKLDDKYILCTSPERFLMKDFNKLISQPIKGTIRKGTSEIENNILKSELKNDIKERAENVMIVDLVRNDLAKSSKPGTVEVEELFGIYTFNTVNQMISTITSKMEDIPFLDSIKNAFPMGSMTGAPKLEVLKNIEHYEDFKRSAYAGSIGYITTEQNFDFNVVIRSIFYNATEQYVSVRVGGAITYDSVAEKEWKEILLKAKSMLDALNAEI